MANQFRIVAFGASMTECAALAPHRRWPALLQRRLNCAFPEVRFEVVNAGVGGNTSREGLARIARDVLAHRPALTLVLFGGNDATPDPARALSVTEYRRTLARIRRRLVAVGSEVAWLSFPPVVDVWHGWNAPDNAAARAKFLPAGGLNSTLHAYRNGTRAFAARHGDLFIDLYAGIRAATERDGCARHILPDGVHFTAAGSREACLVVLAGLTPYLCQRLGTFALR
jgi:lysophospholipase L1-like esterase